MKLKKIMSLLLITGLLAVMMIGCAGSQPQEEQNPPQNNPPQAEENVLPESMEGTATYTGRIDNNSVEMVMQGSPQAFQLTEELMESWDSLGLNEGDQLKIKYEERENDRPILLDVQKL